MNTSRNKTLSPLVSIIIPLYNQELHIQKCLTSVSEQSYDNLEILVIDDGSTDSSMALVKKIAENDARIRLINQENSGVSAARNKGIELATGQLIMFVDSDDWLEHTCIAEAVELWIDASRTAECPLGIRFGHKRGDETFLPQERLMSAHECFVQLLRSYDVCASSVWALLIPQILIEEHTIRFKDEISRSEDVLFLAELYQCGCCVSHYAQPLYNYRVGEGLGSRLYPDALNKAETFFETLNAYPLTEADRDALAHYMARFYILSIIIEATQTNNRLEAVHRALDSQNFMNVMQRASLLKDLPFWARMIAKSALRKNARALSFYLASIQKSLLK